MRSPLRPSTSRPKIHRSEADQTTSDRPAGKAEKAWVEAEERYREIVESAVFGVFQTTPDGRFITANNALARILGYESSEDLMQSVTDIGNQVHVDPERRAEFARILEEAGFVHNFEAQAYRKDGSIIWISLTGSAVRDAIGTATGFEGILEDVTPRVQAERALTESELRYRTMFESAGVSLWEEDFTVVRQMLNDLRAKGVKDLPAYLESHPEFVDEAIAAIRILDVSEHSVRMFGAKHKSELMASLTRILLPATRRAFIEEFLALDRGDRFFESETVVKTLDGRSLNVLFTISFPDEPVLLNHVMVSRTDITELKKVEQALRDSEERNRAVLETAVDGIIVIDWHGIVQSLNPAACRIFGYDAREVAGQNVKMLMPEPDKGRHDGYLARYLETGEKKIIGIGREVTGLRRDGSRFPMELAISEMTIAGERMFTGLVRDITERKQEEQRREFLVEASNILSSSLDYERTLDNVARLVTDRLGDLCSIDLVEDGNVRRVALAHADPAKVALLSNMEPDFRPQSKSHPVLRAVLTGKSELVNGVEEETLRRAARDESHLEALKALQMKSAMVVPLSVGKKVLGAITIVSSEERRKYTQADLALAEELSRRAGIAIDNARLYYAEQKSRTEAEEVQQRLWFLAEANAVLSSSLDFETTLSRVAELGVPWLADCCVAHLFPGVDVEARSVICHVDPSKAELVHELHSKYVPGPDDPHPLIEMIRTQTPVLMEDIGPSDLASIIHDDRHREILEQLGFKSYMAAPLIARGRLFGAITFGTAKQGRRYSRQDLSLAEELARRAALALDNARLYDESQRIQDALRVALEAKDEFLGVMSHELRTPITAIYGGARVLRSRAERLDDESKERLLDDIEQESERLFRMVENLLVLSRLELGQEVSTEPVLVQRLVAKMENAFKQRRPSRTLIVNIDDRLEPVAAEPHYLEQILRNLLSNADKYSQSDRPIEVEASSQDGFVDISVLDRGPGIDSEEIDLIFDRFYRSDRTAAQAAGIGLGLTVCKRLAEAQAGRIWARQREGGGLHIGITLPLCKEA